MYKMVKKYKGDDEPNVRAVNPKLLKGGKVKLSVAAIRKANPKSVLKKAGTINPQLASKRKIKIVKKKKKDEDEKKKPKKKKVVAKAVAMPKASKPKKKAAEGTTSAAMKKDKDKKMKGMAKIRKAPGTY